MEAVERSCQEKINCVSQSSLNYSINITPFSIYIPVRKSLSNSGNPPLADSSLNAGQNDSKLSELKVVEKDSNATTVQIRELEKGNLCLKNSLDEALAVIESKCEEVKILKVKISDLKLGKR